MTAINIIHAAALHCSSHALDERMYMQREFELSLFENYSCDSIYMDIPLNAITCLGHHNFITHSVPTWRSAALDLSGIDWKNDVFEYFESCEPSRIFPPLDSTGELMLKAIGGLVVCTNGNHRLVAAKVWLENRGISSIKQIKVSRYMVKMEILELVRTAIESRMPFSIHKCNWYTKFKSEDGNLHTLNYVVRIGTDKFYAVLNDFIRPFDSEVHWKDTFRKMKDQPLTNGFDEWTEMPPNLLRKILDTTWIQQTYPAIPSRVVLLTDLGF